MEPNVDVAMLRYFVAVAEARSFVAGARKAHVSPPAISKSIRNLEDQLGIRLSERTTRRVVLTEAGERALVQSLKILTELDLLPMSVRQPSSPPSGPLRIGAMEVFSIELLPHALCELIRAHREVVPLSYEMLPHQMIDRLLLAELDIGLTIGAKPVAGIERISLGTSRPFLVCGKGHPLYRRGRISHGGLLEHPSVVPRFLGAEHLPSLDQFPDDRHPRRVGATIELLQMGVELVLGGSLLGYFPDISIRAHLESKRLRALSGIQLGPPFELYALLRANVPPKPAVNELIDRLQRHIREVQRGRQRPRSR